MNNLNLNEFFPVLLVFYELCVTDRLIQLYLYTYKHLLHNVAWQAVWLKLAGIGRFDWGQLYAGPDCTFSCGRECRTFYLFAIYTHNPVKRVKLRIYSI